MEYDDVPTMTHKKIVSVPIAKALASAVTVSITGAGGCGINMLRRITPRVENIPGVTLRRFDTSSSNLRDAIETLIQLANGDGSGMNRKENYDAISKKLSTISDEDLGLADLNIVISSLAGGSGSVIAPVIIKEFERRGGKAIAVVVADTGSGKAADNTLASLRSLQNICMENRIYLPTMVFSNADVGRPKVDVTLAWRLQQLIELITLPAAEIDRNDRRNFFNGIKSIDAQPGVRLLHVFTGKDREIPDGGEVWSHAEGEILDATLSIGILPTGQQDPLPVFAAQAPMARIAFTGTFRDHIITPYMGMITSGNAGLESLMKTINNTKAAFQAQDRNVGTVIDMGDAKPANGGMVF